MIHIEHAGAVATIVMRRPPVNAIDPDFVSAFGIALDDVVRARPTVVVIRSDQKCFSAGADLSLIRGFFREPDGTEAMVAYVKTLHDLFNRLEAIEAVTLCVIDGPALGGGLELALSCDLRVASTRAKLGLPEARVGMIPGAGGTQRLPRLCGPGVAARLILGGEIIDGTEAARLGVVQWAVEAAELESHAAEIVACISGLSRPALLASKHCIAAWFKPAVNGFDLELEKPWQLMKTEEARSRIDAFFTPEIQLNCPSNEVEKQMKLKDKVVAVTGAASGIGLATARAFAEAGARVVLTDINTTAGEAAADELKPAADARFMKLDVTDRASAEALAERIKSEIGRLDILVNAAGWDIIEPFMNNTPEYWTKIVALNFMGPVQVTRALLPLLFESGSGRIVNVSSDAGRVGSFGETVYAGAKGGIIAFTKSLAREVVRKNVRVNCVCPRPDRYAALRLAVGEDAGRTCERDPDEAGRKTVRNRRRDSVFCIRPLKLRHRAGVERERRSHNGRLSFT